MEFKKYEIVLIKFPFSNLEKSKLRPALVIKSLEGENLIVAQITTKTRGISKYEIPLRKEDCKGEIRFDSNIYLDMVSTLHKTLIVKKIGQIKKETIIKKIKEKVREIFCGD